DRNGRATLAWRPRAEPAGTFVVAEIQGGFGVPERRGFRQVRLAAGVERWRDHVRWRAFALAYDGAFDSPGVLRQDDLDAGDVRFWGAYPVVGGGRSSRALVGTDLAIAVHRAG